MSLNNHGNRLANLGWRSEALVASQRAIDIHRTSIGASPKPGPDAFFPDLAARIIGKLVHYAPASTASITRSRRSPE
jgi:hypothetical protein